MKTRLSIIPLCVISLTLAGVVACGDSDVDPTSDQGVAQEGGPGTDGGPVVKKGYPVEQCENPAMTAPATGTCVAGEGTGETLLFRGTLLMPDRVLENGHLLVDQGKIACASCDCSAHALFASARTIECADGVISPGLINPHDHIAWTKSAPVNSDVRYDHRQEWRTGKNGKPEINYPKSDKRNEVYWWGELRMLMGGATSIMGEGAGPGLIRNLDSGPNNGLDKPYVNNATFPLGDIGGEMRDQQCTYPKLPDELKVANNLAYVPHVAEGVSQAARNEFLCLSGQEEGSVDITLPNTAFIHAVGLTTTDILDMAQGGTLAIWSPRTNISLYGFTADVTLMGNLGVPVALGTDWTISGSMNMLRELACADYLNSTHYNGFYSDGDLWAMATGNAAQSVRLDDTLGKLAEGMVADLAIFNGKERKSHAAVIRAGVGDVALVMRGGDVLYGDDALVQALAADGAQGCEAMEVCTLQKRVCLEREIQMNFTALKGSVGTAYDLFFCGEPTGEPTCVPSRPGEYDGTVSATDSDGDGLADAEDNCPMIFNPPRPMEDMKQVDTDGDKAGDICDPCPLDADTTVCASSPDPDDKDGDGVNNDVDNCPTKANKDQADADGDKIGDACDTCDKPNPGGTACPITIKELRDPSLGKRPADGTLVGLQDVVVIGVRLLKSAGFFAREGTGPYEAIFIYTQTAPADASGTPLVLGDMVSLEGKMDDFYDTAQLSSPAKITVTGSGLTDPIQLSTAALQPGSTTAEEHESQLVQISGVTVTAMSDPGNNDTFWVTDSGDACSGDTPACTMINDFFYDASVVDGKPAAAAGQTFSTITGLVNGFRSEHTLDPRDDADLVTP